MLTSSYEFCAPRSRSSKGRTSAAAKPNVALVHGTIRGVPFMLYYKCLAAARRFAETVRGAEVIEL